MAISPICTEAPVSTTTSPLGVSTKVMLHIIPWFSGLGNRPGIDHPDMLRHLTQRMILTAWPAHEIVDSLGKGTDRLPWANSTAVTADSVAAARRKRRRFISVS